MAGIDGYTKLLLHCNGVDGSPVFIDSELTPKAITTYGDAQIDTAQYKFGQSGLFDGTGDYLTALDSADWTFGAGDFTIDCWVRFNALPILNYHRMIVSQWVTDANSQYLSVSNIGGVYSLNYYSIATPSNILASRTYAFVVNTWYHLAVIRTGSTFRLFVNGTQVGADYTSSSTSSDISSVLYVGRLPSSNSHSWNGWIDELRISKGIARWTSNFTPPTEEYSLPFQTILSDAKIKIEDIQQIILSDAKIFIGAFITSDAKIKAEDLQETILSDSKIVNLYQQTILSDAKIKILAIQKTILSNAKICIQVLVDFVNKINITKQTLSDINNKINTAIGVISDVTNFINFCKSVISDINNDFRTKKLLLSNINHDVRFLYSWQKAADGSLQSLGKEYIKVYINSIEQTDVDNDSINIGKDLDVAHTTSFDLGRAYDSTKPTMEHTVLIKYNNWTLFSGYITQISPTADPEKMRINCQNEHWKQNQENVYFNVGHKPQDDKELYYNTINNALTTVFAWNPGIGNFVPQIITCFAESKSDTVSNLITQCGNYGWFYDVDGTRKLWSAGEGSIVELERQVLGENINLYNVINHSFEESVDDIINKFRVQMGDTVYRKFSNTNSGTSITHTVSFNHFTDQTVSPDWDGTYEVLAKNSGNGYGYGNNPSEENAFYQDVFRKYSLNLQSTLESWTDIYEPYIEIKGVNCTGLMNMSGEQLQYYTYLDVKRITYGVLYNGFTIDYKKGKVYLSDPVYAYDLNDKGECINIRAPRVTVHIGKTTTYTYTEDSNPAVEDPETDVSNPLMFFTAKMGSYPLTILKQLNLSQFSIQVGYTREYMDGNVLKTETIPSWDDTDFAKEYADWQLSKTCDKKIKGTITITLDALCFYNIDLTKRIYIAGITDESMNITSINYNISDFTATLTLENSRYFNRTVSLPSRGE